MALRLSHFVLAAALTFAASAHAQQFGSSTSTTTTKTKTTTTTTGTSWKSPDGTKGGSSTTTTTNTRSQSTTIGTAAPSPARPAPGLPAPGPSQGVQWMAGGWNVSESGKRGACRVQLYTGLESGGGATSSGCQSDIKGIGNWALRGDTLLLIKNIFTTAATLQRTGPSRFDGHTASGAAISIWR